MKPRIVWISLIAVLLSAATLHLASAAPQVVWGPVIGDITTSTARITWRTNVEVPSRVLMDGAPPSPASPRLYHRVDLYDLLPGHTYTYRVQVDGAKRSAGPYSFRTPAAGLDHFTFVAYGDTRSNPAAHAKIIKAISHANPALVLHTGDLVSDGNNVSDWKGFFGAIGSLFARVPLYTVLGNHEGNSDIYYQMLPLPRGGGDYAEEWYSFTYGNCFFLALDTARNLDAQAQWARKQLALPHPGVRWRIALFHVPPFGSTRGLNATIINKFVPILEAGGVNLVINGHDHAYQRSVHNNTTYLVTGGGGAPLYSVNVKRNPYQKFAVSTQHYCTIQVSTQSLVIRALSPSGKLLDTATIEHR